MTTPTETTLTPELEIQLAEAALSRVDLSIETFEKIDGVIEAVVQIVALHPHQDWQKFREAISDAEWTSHFNETQAEIQTCNIAVLNHLVALSREMHRQHLSQDVSQDSEQESDSSNSPDA